MTRVYKPCVYLSVDTLDEYYGGLGELVDMEAMIERESVYLFSTLGLAA